MTEDEIRRDAFAMPIYNPAYPPGPYRFVDREYLIITYRTDPAMLEKIIPAPLDYGEVRVATGTMGFKHKALDPDPVIKSLGGPNYLLKIMPHVDGTPRICELVRYSMTEINLKGAWSGPGALTLVDHALAPV